MRIVPRTTSLMGLFETARFYQVPPYQRNFAWESDKVLNFWDDFRDVYIKGDGDNKYFFGSMVFTPISKDMVRVLDGQQRIATTLLLLAATRENTKKSKKIENPEKWASHIEKYIFVAAKNDPSVKRAKLQLNTEDHAFFERILETGVPPRPERYSHKLLMKAYSTFLDKTKKLIETGGEAYLSKTIDTLDMFQVIEIEVDSEANAHIIFETLNDRGLRLSEADLTKNYLYSIAEDNLNDVADKWVEITKSVGDHNVTRFLRHYWSSNYGITRKQELYKKIKDEIKKSNIKRNIGKISTEAKLYANLKEPTHDFWMNGKIEALLKDLRMFKVEQVYILLLAVFEKLDVNKVYETLKELINLTFKYNKISKLNPNELEKFFSDMSVKVRSGNLELKTLEKNIRDLNPSKEIFLDSFVDFEVKSNKLAKYILNNINNELLKKAGKPELSTNVARTNLEHIIPKNPDSKWKEYFNRNDIEEESLIYKIGNMTILLEEYNRKIANKFYKEKKKMYKKSTLPINSDISRLKMFSPKHLQERQERFGKLAYEIWSKS